MASPLAPTTHARPPPPLLYSAASALLVQFPGLLGLLALLAWAAADLLAAAWAALHSRPELLQQLAGGHSGLAASLQQALDAEGSLDRATLALLRHALPALPALLLGLLLREGGELVSVLRAGTNPGSRLGRQRGAALRPSATRSRGAPALLLGPQLPSSLSRSTTVMRSISPLSRWTRSCLCQRCPPCCCPAPPSA